MLLKLAILALCAIAAVALVARGRAVSGPKRPSADLELKRCPTCGAFADAGDASPCACGRG